MDVETFVKIKAAIAAIQNGVCKRVEVDDQIKVYECKNIIRIDIKNEVQNG